MCVVKYSVSTAQNAADKAKCFPVASVRLSAFCRGWRRCGFDLFILYTIILNHSNLRDFTSCVLERSPTRALQIFSRPPRDWCRQTVGALRVSSAPSDFTEPLADPPLPQPSRWAPWEMHTNLVYCFEYRLVNSSSPRVSADLVLVRLIDPPRPNHDDCGMSGNMNYKFRSTIKGPPVCKIHASNFFFSPLMNSTEVRKVPFNSLADSAFSHCCVEFCTGCPELNWRLGRWATAWCARYRVLDTVFISLTLYNYYELTKNQSTVYILY